MSAAEKCCAAGGARTWLVCSKCSRQLCLQHAVLLDVENAQSNELLCYPACVPMLRCAEILEKLRATFVEVAPTVPRSMSFSELLDPRWWLHADSVDERLAAEELLRSQCYSGRSGTLDEWLDKPGRTVEQVADQRAKNQAGGRS